MYKHVIILTAVLFITGCGATGSAQTVNETVEQAAPAGQPTDRPVADETAADETAADETAADEPAADETAADEPILYRDFTAYRLDGTAVTLSEHIGVPMVLNFWATWCGPCRLEMPHFDKLEDEFEDVMFFMVNLTDGQADTPETVAAYLEENGYEFKHALLDSDGQAAAEYGIYSIPVTLFINTEGHIVNGKLGTMTEEELREAVTELN